MFRHVAKEELRVPGKVEYLGELRDFVTRVGKKYGFSERIINAFKLSIDEAATNIIKHAYRDWDGDITLRAVAKKNSLTMVLVDQGKYFDPRKVASPDLQRYVDIGKKGGLGIFIMRRLLDGIDYRKTEEGNELWMVKNSDQAKRRKMTLTTIPLSLKMRYWLYSLVIFTGILVVISYISFSNTRQKIIDGYIENARTACSSLQGEVLNNWSVIDPEVISYLKEHGSYDIEVRAGADAGISTITQSHKDILKEVLIVDKRSVILASSDTTRSVWEEAFEIPQSAKTLQTFDDSRVLLMHADGGKRILDIEWPLKDKSNDVLAVAHFQIDYGLIQKDIQRYLRSLLGETALVWLIVSAGLCFLIYVVMSPFKRLQEWVKHMSEPGIVDEMDIDSSTEIGAIAQAFSDMTNQLRRSQQNLAEQERLQQEMHIAKQIQQTLLPKEFPELEGYEIASYYAAAKEVGGDFFDFVEVDSDTLGIAVADVSGKGVPGAFVMTMIRTALRSEARGVKDAAEVLAKVNDFVVSDMKKGMFVTLLYVIIDSKKRRLNFASAGHNPMILHRPSRNKTYYLNPRGFPIGISLPDKNLFRESIQSDTIALAEDDVVLVYTDGVTEAMNHKRRLFGEERFLKLIRESGNKSADEFVQALQEEMNIFTEGSEQNDDITLVAIKERTSAEKVEFERAVRAYTLVQNGKGIREACKEAGISTYSYYHKYKERFDRDGVDSFSPETEVDQIEAKHLSIEEKSKIYDVIRRHPEYGAKRIHEELNSERYEFTVIPVSKIYDELVRMHLNTKQLRESFVQRGGRKKRIKPPGTPMMTLDGKLIMNRAQYEEPIEDEADDVVEPAKPEKPAAPKPPVGKQQAPEQVDEKETKDVVEEETTPNVFAIDKEKLLTAPLEDILDKRTSKEDKDEDAVDEDKDEELSTVEDEAVADDELEDEDEFEEVEDVEEVEDEQGYEDFDEIFGYVEDAALTDGPNEIEQTKERPRAPEEDSSVKEEEKESGNFTIVTDEKIREYVSDDFDADDELSKIEENLLDEADIDEDSDLELLSSLSDNENGDDDLGFSFNYVDDDQEEIFESAPDAPEDKEKDHDEEKEESSSDAGLQQADKEGGSDFIGEDIEEDASSEGEKALFLLGEESSPYDDPSTLSVDNYADEFKELLPSDENPFDYWIREEDSRQDAKTDTEVDDEESEFFNGNEYLGDPFEEFLEIQDEQGLITPEGELDYEIVDQLLQSGDGTGMKNGDEVDGEKIINDLPKSVEEVEKREQEDQDISLDELVTISNDEEPLFAQHDEEFDSLLKDAVSNDERIQQLLSETAKTQDNLKEVNNNIESALQRASDLYRESRYEDAVRILRDIAEKHPSDYRPHSMLGNAYFREKRYKEAALEYERVIDLDPLNEKACENLAIAYANLGELIRAIHQWERLLRITPNRMDIQKSIQKEKAFLNKN